MSYKVVRKALERFHERSKEDKQKCLKNLREGIEKKQIKADEVHLGELFEATVPNGPRIFESMMEGQGELQEGATATDTAAFRYLTTGLFNTVFLEAWENPEFIGQKLVNMSQQTRAPRGRRIPGVARIGSSNVKEGIGELEAYPVVGPSEISILTQPIKKFGFIQKVSREMMVADPGGGQVMNQIQAGAEAESYKFEVYLLKHVLGIINNYTADFVGADTTYNTYGTLPNGISNIVTSNPLGTPDAVQNVKNRAYTQTNPITGDLINTGRIKAVVVPHQLEVVANHYRTAANVERVLLPTDGTTYTYRSMSENPYPRDYTVLTSPLVYSLTSSATTWFAGDFERDIYFTHFWDKEVVTRGMESEEAFTNDVFFMYKNSRAGVGEFRDLVHIYKNTA